MREEENQMIRIDLFTFFISEIFHSCIIVQAIALPLSMEWSRRGKKLICIIIIMN